MSMNAMNTVETLAGAARTMTTAINDIHGSLRGAHTGMLESMGPRASNALNALGEAAAAVQHASGGR